MNIHRVLTIIQNFYEHVSHMFIGFSEPIIPGYGPRVWPDEPIYYPVNSSIITRYFRGPGFGLGQ